MQTYNHNILLMYTKFAKQTCSEKEAEYEHEFIEVHTFHNYLLILDCNMYVDFV